MPNSLSSAPPAAPQQTPQNGLQPPQSPQGGQGAQPQQAPAPPSHAETVAALRHFDAIKSELTPLLANPALGKSDLKSQIIDGTTKLVSERFISAATAVQQLSQVPTDPLEQRKYLQNMMAQTMQAENAILDHYKEGNPSLGDAQGHFAANDGGNRDDHMNLMAALHANYSGGKNA